MTEAVEAAGYNLNERADVFGSELPITDVSLCVQRELERQIFCTKRGKNLLTYSMNTNVCFTVEATCLDVSDLFDPQGSYNYDQTYVGEYLGDVGEYLGDVGEVGEMARGDVGLY